MTITPKILYDPQLFFSLRDFGIDIPSSSQKILLTLEVLSKSIDPEKLQSTIVDHISGILTASDLLRVHSPQYVADLFSNRRNLKIMEAFELIGPDGRFNRYSPEGACRSLEELFELILKNGYGTYESAQLALDYGFCFYFGGGMHHGHYDFSYGFCPINDVVIAAEKLLAQRGLSRIWIIDVDAHKGDGTAALTQGCENIITLSIHMAQGWPLDLPRICEDGTEHPCFTPSTIDIPIESGEESSYLSELEKGLDFLKQSGRADLAFVLLGADPFVEDELPSSQLLQLSEEQMLARDKMIYSFLEENHVPGAYVMAGGYGDAAYKVFSAFLKYVLSRA